MTNDDLKLLIEMFNTLYTCVKAETYGEKICSNAKADTFKTELETRMLLCQENAQYDKLDLYISRRVLNYVVDLLNDDELDRKIPDNMYYQCAKIIHKALHDYDVKEVNAHTS